MDKDYFVRYREKNRELLREKQRIYREKHREELRKKQGLFPALVLPPQLNMLNEDEKKVWLFLKTRGEAFRVDIRGYTGWGHTRTKRALDNLERRRLIGFNGKRVIAKEPMV